MTGDPFEQLVAPVASGEPHPRFTALLRDRLVQRLGIETDPIPTIDLPERNAPMSTTQMHATVVPYLAARDAGAMLDWYVDAFDAVEVLRVVGDDGRIGHAELTIGGARFYLSDEYPEYGVHSPASLGGCTTTLHLTVPDVDARYARAVTAGATAISEPADQPHGARHGTLVDPAGHRWMISQQIEDISVAEYARRSEGSGFDVVGAGPDERVTAADRPGTGGGIWAGAFYEDALGAIRFLVDTFGFQEQLVVTAADGTTVVHSQLRWPEGGVVQVGTYDPTNVFTHAPGQQSLYVVTADPDVVWQRCRELGLEVIREPHAPDHDPAGLSFSLRDPEGNIWSFGTYGLGA
jgi:PhnB protein